MTARASKAARRRDLERQARDYKVSTRSIRGAAALIERWQWTTTVEELLTSAVGRPRFLPWRGFLVLLVVHAMRSKGTMVLTETLLTALAMSDKQRQIAGLPAGLAYHHVEGNFSDWRTAFEETVDLTTGEIFPARFPYSVDQIISDLCDAAAPAFLAQAATQAADGIAIESPYRRQSSSDDGRPDVVDDQLPVDNDETTPRMRKPGWPRIGLDGRKQHTVDLDAREGYRTAKPGQTSIYIGWEPTTVCDAPGTGEPSRFAFIRSIAFKPAGSDRCAAGLAALDQLHTRPDEVLVDRGYNYTRGFGAGLITRGIGMVGDLHANQRTTRPGLTPGTLLLDQDLFTDAVPEELHSLGAFPRGFSQEQRLALAAQYDRRAAYAYTTMGRPDAKTGRLRFRGLALTGKVRCPSHPPSMRLKTTSKRPRTACTPERPCGCAKTVTLYPDIYARTFQTEIYGTTPWLASYGRRVAIESSNGELRTNRIKITRFSFLVRGRIGTALLFGVLCAVANILGLADWYGTDWNDLLDLDEEPPKFIRRAPGQEATHRLVSRAGPPRE